MRTGRIILVAMLAAALPLGCGERRLAGKGAGGPAAHVLCSTFPMWLFTRAVTAGREGVAVELMLPAAMGCPHDYELTTSDMQKIARADVVIANGLGMENFLGARLRRANPTAVLIDTSSGIGDLIQLKGEEHEPKEAGAESYHHSAGPNPHLFASPAMAARVVRNIAAGLGRVDPNGAELYMKNAEAYANKLEKLSGEFAAALAAAPNRKIVTEHAVFDYLARDAGLQIVAVVEEEPGQEPSAAAMLELIRTIKAGGAAALFTEPQYPAKVGQTIAREAGIPVAVLDPVANGPADAGPDYYEKTMRANLDTLVKTLKAK